MVSSSTIFERYLNSLDETLKDKKMMMKMNNNNKEIVEALDDEE